jgi:hypothetical protein
VPGSESGEQHVVQYSEHPDSPQQPMPLDVQKSPTGQDELDVQQSSQNEVHLPCSQHPVESPAAVQ